MDDRSNFMLLAIVAIVAIVSLVVLITGSRVSGGTSSVQGDMQGEAVWSLLAQNGDYGISYINCEKPQPVCPKSQVCKVSVMATRIGSDQTMTSEQTRRACDKGLDESKVFQRTWLSNFKKSCTEDPLQCAFTQIPDEGFTLFAACNVNCKYVSLGGYLFRQWRCEATGMREVTGHCSAKHREETVDPKIFGNK